MVSDSRLALLELTLRPCDMTHKIMHYSISHLAQVERSILFRAQWLVTEDIQNTLYYNIDDGYGAHSFGKKDYSPLAFFSFLLPNFFLVTAITVIVVFPSVTLPSSVGMAGFRASANFSSQTSPARSSMNGSRT